MSLQRVMFEHGLLVPTVHGWIDDLPAYVMDRVEGQPGFDGLTVGQRDHLMRDYMAELAKLHRLPLKPFLEAGIQRAANSSEAGSYGSGASKPYGEPARTHRIRCWSSCLGWLQRNPAGLEGPGVDHRVGLRQFHQRDGRIVAVLDVEIGHIGDPMMDLAALADARHGHAASATSPTLYRPLRARSTGEPVDLDAIQRHHFAFTLTNELAVSERRCDDPLPESDLMTNLQWCCETNLLRHRGAGGAPRSRACHHRSLPLCR